MSWSIPAVSANFLSIKERTALAPLFDAIFPGDPDKGIPTTALAETINYVNRLLSCDDSIYHEISSWRQIYREGLVSLETASNKHFATQLASLTRAQATALLIYLERGELNLGIDQYQFFRLLRTHCLQGCFSDPAWGGNNDQIMWRWLGYRTAPEDVTV